jgi:hypothetical protein
MVGFLVVTVLVVGLVFALPPAQRGTWRPGFTVVIDRDRDRLVEELTLLESFEPADPVPQAAAADGLCQELESAAAA